MTYGTANSVSTVLGVYSALDGESEEAADNDNAVSTDIADRAVSTDIAAAADRADSAANADTAEAASAADNTTRKQGEEHDEKSVSGWN